MSADVTVLVSNWRLQSAPDRGRFRWLLGGRRRRAVKLARRHNPDVILAQELDEVMIPYVAAKLGMAVVKPTAGNRPVLYRPEVFTLEATNWADLGGRSFAHAALLDASGARAWYVSVHLSTDAALRDRQKKALSAFVASLGASAPVVLGGDFNSASASISGLLDVRGLVPTVGNRTANSLHGWGTQRYESRWIDWLLVSPRTVAARWLDLILTSPEDEADHNWLLAGLTITSATDTR